MTLEVITVFAFGISTLWAAREEHSNTRATHIHSLWISFLFFFVFSDVGRIIDANRRQMPFGKRIKDRWEENERTGKSTKTFFSVIKIVPSREYPVNCIYLNCSVRINYKPLILFVDIRSQIGFVLFPSLSLVCTHFVFSAASTVAAFGRGRRRWMPIVERARFLRNLFLPQCLLLLAHAPTLYHLIFLGRNLPTDDAKNWEKEKSLRTSEN